MLPRDSNISQVCPKDSFIKHIPSTKAQGIGKAISFQHSHFNISKIKKSQLMNAKLSTLLAFTTILFSYINNELLFSNDLKQDVSINILRAVIMILTAIQCIFSYHYHNNLLKMRMAFKQVSSKSKAYLGLIWHDRDIFKKFIVDILLSVGCVPPGVHWDRSFIQLGKIMHLSLDDLMFPIICLRVSHLAKLVYELSSFNSSRAAFHW